MKIIACVVMLWCGIASADPALRKAIAGVDESDPRSVAKAIDALDAVAAKQIAAALPEVMAVAEKPATKQTFALRVAAIRTLGKLGNADAIKTLAAIAARELPPMHAQPQVELAVLGATVNALGELRSPKAVPVLVPLLVRAPPLMMQLRRALAASPGAADEVRKVLAGQHAAVEALVKKHGYDRYCGDKNDRPKAQCQPIASKQFAAAIVLGDLRDAKAVPELVKLLERDTVPAYYADDNPGPTAHHAAVDALRKIGTPDLAPKLRAVWAKGSDVAKRTLAASVYGYLARDAAGIDDLGKIAADNNADDNLRQAAAQAFAQLAREPQHVDVMLQLAKKYLAASADKRTSAAKHKAAHDAAEAELAKAKQKLEDVKAKLIALTKDPKATADEIRAQTAAAKQANDDFKAAKKKHREATAPYKMDDNAAKAYTGFARMFQGHAARIELGIRCKDDSKCFADALKLAPDAVAKQVAKYLPDASGWDKDEKTALYEAYADRAILELAKRGDPTAAETLAKLLPDASRFVQQAILIALPKIAKRPCAACVTNLDATLAKLGTTSSDLSVEVAIVTSLLR